MGKHSTSTVLAVFVLAVIVGAGVWIYVVPAFNSLSSTQQYAHPAAPNSGATAYCPADQIMHSISPFGSNPVPIGVNCQNVAETLQITPQALGGVGTSNTFAIGTYEKGTGVGCKIFQNINGKWSPIEFDQASSAGVCTTTGTFLPGAQIDVVFCVDDASNCLTADFTAQTTVAQCPLPSIVAAGVLCNSGPGSGYVPFWTPSGSTSIQYSYNMPVVSILGEESDSNNPGAGTASSTANLLTWTYQNGTAVTAASNCFLSAGSANCDAPKATELGRFSLQAQLADTGTFPAAPYSLGYSSWTSIDPAINGYSCTTGSLNCANRGSLNYVLQVALVQSASSTGACVISNGGTITGAASITPVIIPQSSTKTIYDYVIPDSLMTRSTDQSGNILTTGVVNELFQMDCSQFYSVGTGTVTITGTQYAYFSTAYAQAYSGNAVNPEAVTTGPTAFAITINF